MSYIGFRSISANIASVFNAECVGPPRRFFVAKHRSPYILVLPMQIMVKRLGLLRQDSMSKLRDIELDLGFGN